MIRPAQRAAWCAGLIIYTCVWDRSSWHWWAVTESTVCVVQLGAVADWWCSWPIANTLACLCLCKRQTFWTYFVTINLFYLYLMNFMFHTVLDAAGDVLIVHYKSMKRDVSFPQGRVSTIFKWGGHFSYIFSLTTVQKLQNLIKIFQSYDHKCTAIVYGSQCICEMPSGLSILVSGNAHIVSCQQWPVECLKACLQTYLCF